MQRESIMAKAKIISAPTNGDRTFLTTIKNTSISQRETLEEVIINLASALKIEVIHTNRNSRGSYFYEVQAKGFAGFQSASNTILELSRKLAVNCVDA